MPVRHLNPPVATEVQMMIMVSTVMNAASLTISECAPHSYTIENNLILSTFNQLFFVYGRGPFGTKVGLF